MITICERYIYYESITRQSITVSEFETAVFEEKHLISIMMFLFINGPTRKIDIYSNVSNNPHIPEKLNRLESLGLLTQVSDRNRRSIIIELTDKGKEVATFFIGINKLLAA